MHPGQSIHYFLRKQSVFSVKDYHLLLMRYQTQWCKPAMPVFQLEPKVKESKANYRNLNMLSGELTEYRGCINWPVSILGYRYQTQWLKPAMPVF